MAAARRVAEGDREGGQAWVTTGLGIRKTATIHAAGHDRLTLRQHLIGHGPPAPPDVVRAMALRLANALASGTTVARPVIAERLVDALNDDRLPAVRVRGSIGQSDLAAMADLADGFLGDLELVQGEAIALLNQSSFSTGWGALPSTTPSACSTRSTWRVRSTSRGSARTARCSTRRSPSARTRAWATLERLDGLLAEVRGAARPAGSLSFRTLPQMNGGLDASASCRSSSRSSSTRPRRTPS
jgi:hypothetical protein